MQGLLSNERLGNSSLWGSSGSNIKSIQSGYTSSLGSLTTLNIAISSVDTTKSVVTLSYEPESITSVSGMCILGKLTSSTSLNLSRSTSTTDSPRIYWTVIEYQNIKSVQQGTATITYGGSSSISVTISSVNVLKSILTFNYSAVPSTSDVLNHVFINGGIASSTTISFGCSQASSSGYTIQWFVVEFN